MAEHIPIGSVDCDFLPIEEFYTLCTTWLTSNTFHHVVTLNAEMVVLAEHDSLFRQAMGQATIRVPEGGPTWARSYLAARGESIWPSLWVFMRQRAERITGTDMVWQLAALAAEMGQSVYLLGGTPSQAEGTRQVLQKAFPALKITHSSEHVFSIDGPPMVIQDIQQKKPAILLVAYGAPAQSIWIEEHQHQLPSVRIAVGVGGAFAMIAGELPRAPQWLRQMNVEWVWRLILQPWRLKRIWRAVVVFPQIIKRQKLSIG